MHSSVLYITSAVASETGCLPTSAQHHIINATILKDVIGLFTVCRSRYISTIYYIILRTCVRYASEQSMGLLCAVYCEFHMNYSICTRACTHNRLHVFRVPSSSGGRGQCK